MKKETEQMHTESGAGKDRERKKRTAAAAVAVVTSASMLVGGIFNSPAALLADEDLMPQQQVADDTDLDGPGGGDGDGGAGDDGGQSEEEEREELRGGARAGLRRRILQLPCALRLLVILPLWGLGWLILSAGAALWSALLSPLLAKALTWLLFLGALAGAFLLAGKTVFPDLPVKKILNRRSLLGLLLGAAALGLADLVLPLFWAEYTRLENIVRAVGVLLVFGTVMALFARRELRRRRELAAGEQGAEEPAESAPRAASRQEALALADSVSRPR